MTGRAGASVLAALLVALPVATGCGGVTDEGPIVVESAWARPTTANAAPDAAPPRVPGVLYLVLRNAGDTADRLLGVESEICREAELHVTRVDDGVATMDHVAGVDLPAGERVEMAPGGTHVMLFGLARHLRPGDRFPVVLRLERAGAVSAEAVVREP